MFGARREIIGIDLGSGWAKAVVLRMGDQGEAPSVGEFAIAPAEPGWDRVAIEKTLRRLLRKLRAKTRDLAVAIWPKDAKLRFFDRGTPEAARATTRISPKEVEGLFHEELAGFVSTCGPVESCHESEPSSMCVAEAVPEAAIHELEAAVGKIGRRLQLVQLTPLALLNAFTSSCLETARNAPFLVADFGRERTLILGGCGGVARAVRVVDFPWEAILADGKGKPGAEGTVPAAQGLVAMQVLLKELVDVCDFLDAQDHHLRLDRMHVSGALSTNLEVMKNLGQALEVDCVPWNPLRSAVAADQAVDDFNLLEHLPRLPVAAGAALQFVSG